MIEVWKPLVGFEGYYEISNYGYAKRIKTRGPASKFTNSDIEQIRGLLDSGITKTDIAKLYKCCRESIQKIGISTEIKNGGIIKHAVRRDGYAFITPCIKCKTKMVTIHSAVMAAFVGIRPDGHEINHKDGNKLNNRLDNLEYCTPSENSRHAIVVLSKNCKLSHSDVIEIRNMLANKITRQQIADTFGISKSVIHHIATGYSWSYV